MREPLGLDRWQIKVVFGPAENLAACSADPEYRQATIYFDPDRFQTGDELDETLAHELDHCHLWPIATAADDLVLMAVELLPEAVRPATLRYLKEQVRRAEEDSATQVGRAYATLFRRLWAAEAALQEAEKETRSLRRQLRERTDDVK